MNPTRASAKPINDLRCRMLQHMTNRSFGDMAQREYLRHSETFASSLGRSSDTATSDDVRQFQAQQISDGTQSPKMNTQALALRFFFTVSLGRVDLAYELAHTRYSRIACTRALRPMLWDAYSKHPLAPASSTRRH